MYVLITGTTGMVGKSVLQECINDKRVKKIYLINRLPVNLKSPKISEFIISDFLKVGEVKKNIKMHITSDPAGVIHSWAVPSLGVKMDAIPGRLNETYYRIEEPGLYYGQCSELCGPGHGFMPISIRAVTDEEFVAWLEEAKEEFASTKDEQIVLK